MIIATFKKKNDHFISYSVIGHANYAPHGQDIVCAAVSSLYTAITNSLIRYHKAKIDNEGIVQLDVSSESEVGANILHAGLLDIQSQYPENISVVDDADVISANEIITGTLKAQDIKLGPVINSTDQIEHLRQKLI